MLERLKDIDLNSKCSEETLLYQLVSGLHTSINMHVSHNYVEIDSNNTRKNYEMFMGKLGTYPDRIRNLFFLYAVTLRAINRA